MSKKWVDVSKIGEVASRGKSYTDSLVSSLSTATQDALSELDETKQEKFDGLPGTVASFDESGEPTAISMWSNENLLRNADFRYPENQNGMEIYVVNSTTEPIPCLNDWWLIGHGSLVIEDGYIRLVPSSSGSYVTMYQDIPLAHALHIIGNPATVSMFGTGPMVAYFAGYDSGLNEEVNLGWPSLMAPANASLTGEETLYHNTYYDFDALDNGRFLRAKFSAMLSNGEARYIGVKLERGSASTLGYKTSTGWKLNVVMPTYSMPSDEVTIVGEPGKMAVYNEDGELSFFNGNAGDLVTFNEDGNVVSTPVSGIVPTNTVRVNRNMIPNWNFKNAINSQRLLNYPISSSLTTCLDGWTIPNGSMVLSDEKTVSYIVSTKTDPSSFVTILQTSKIYGNKVGIQYTLSFLVGNILNGSVRASITFDDDVKFVTPVLDSTQIITGYELLTVTFIAPSDGFSVSIEHKDETNLRCSPYAIKLEEGSESTLAYKDVRGIWTTYEESIDERTAWCNANGRVPVGKNLLMNADFKHFRNPLRTSAITSKTAENDWIPNNYVTIFCDNSPTVVSKVTYSITGTISQNSGSEILKTTTVEGCLEGEIYTLSILADSFEQPGDGYFDLVLAGKTVTGGEMSLGITRIKSGEITSLTAVVPAAINNGCLIVKVRHITNVSFGVSTHEFSIRPIKIKLEAGPVETLSREVGYEDEFSVLRVLPPIINGNLLINGDFRAFIDETNVDVHTGFSRYIGGWYVEGDDSGNRSLIRHSDYITLSYTKSSKIDYLFYQNMDCRLLPGEPISISIVYRLGNNNNTNLVVGGKTQTSFTLGPTNTSWKIANFIATVPEMNNNMLTIGIKQKVNETGSIDIQSIKCEKGPYSTLARYNLSGSLEYLDSVHPFDELKKVHRRQICFSDYSVLFSAIPYNSTSIGGVLTLPNVMERPPSPIDPSNIDIHQLSTGNNIIVNSISQQTISQNLLYIRCSSDGLILNQQYTIRSRGTGVNKFCLNSNP